MGKLGWCPVIQDNKPFAAFREYMDEQDRAEDEPPASPDEPEAPEDERPRFPRINWKEAFSRERTEPSWLRGRFMERAQQISIVGGGKVGKSLFLDDWLWRAISGRPFLGDHAERDPINVLYLDQENSEDQIVDRMIALGATWEELERLDYRPFPQFSGAFDVSATALAELFALVEEEPRDLVVLDTVSRFIAGKENDSDTWLAFYRRVHSRLKQAGIGCVRLDHMGKDEERGARGSSAKEQDVDHVWELSRLSETANETSEGTESVINLRLRRTASRTGIGDDVFHITRKGLRGPKGLWLPGTTRHELTSAGAVTEHVQTVQLYADQLIMAGIPEGLGRDRMKAWARQHGVELPSNNPMLAEIVRAVKYQQDA